MKLKDEKADFQAPGLAEAFKEVWGTPKAVKEQNNGANNTLLTPRGLQNWTSRQTFLNYTFTERLTSHYNFHN